jgi:hypothetical protein
MIFWLASYPKSGNTWIRSLLAAYLYSEEGNFKFDLLKNIKQFSINSKKLDEKNLSQGQEKIYKNWIPFQKKINQDNKLHILKTHNALCSINGYKFTDKNNTIGAIYIVRDPRNLILSIAHHYSLSFEEAYEFLSNKKKIIFPLKLGKQNKNPQQIDDFNFLGNWSEHYKSWKNINFCPVKIIKYEDMLENDHEVFLSILDYLSKFMKISLDKKKINNTIATTKFKKLSHMEDKKGFEESVFSQKTNEKLKFFNLGKKNDWKRLLDNKIIKKVEQNFGKEMKELNYL